MAISILGVLEWNSAWDEEGFRTYNLKLLLESDNYNDGPANVSLTPGLPVVGDHWDIGDDLDLGVWCRNERSFNPVITNEPNRHWTADFVYSNRPLKKCSEGVDNPLLEPPLVSITFSRYIVFLRYDQDGRAIVSSTYELLPEDIREADRPRPRVAITRNSLTSTADAAAILLANVPGQPGSLNSSTMWGLPARTIRLANYTSNDRWYGTCIKYYEETFEFEIEYDTWDVWAFDQGYKHFQPEDPATLYAAADPAIDFVGNLCDDRDADGNPTGTKSGPYLELLDGSGNILQDYDNPVKERLEKYGESDLLLLGGIPASL